LLAQLVTDGTNTANITGTASYFNDHQVQIEVIARTKAQSSEMNWRINLQDSDAKSYFGGTNIGAGTTSAGLDQSDGEFVTVDLGTYDLGGHKAIQAIVNGNSPTSTVDVAGVRFVNAGNTSGVAVQSLSAGGYRAIDFLNNHDGQAGAFKAFVEDDIVAIQFGANDGVSRTAEQFKADLEALIERLREWTGNPELPIILIADPDRVLTAAQRLEFDKFPAVAAEIALELENVLALNTRKIAANNGWFVGSDQFASFVSDDVHYTEFGEKQLAKWQVDSLIGLTSVPEPSAFIYFSAVLVLLAARRRT
jgi:lysophospholipase L1-like esterase